MARPYTGFSPEVKEIILARSYGACEVMLPGCTQRGEEIQHRRARGMGSTRRLSTNAASNGLMICRSCHNLVEGSPLLAAEKGWRITQTSDPLVERVWWRSRMWLWLDDLGGTHDQPPAGVVAS